MLRGRTEQEESVTEAEIAELRRRLTGQGVDAPDTQATTLGDLAEATGRSREEVLGALDQLRSERAFGQAPKPKSQVPLAILAAVLFVVAVLIFWLPSRKYRTETEIQEELQKLNRQRAARPPKIRYPILVKPAGNISLPPGMQISTEGMLTHTEVKAPDQNWLPESAARQQFEAALVAVINEARNAEINAPKPEKPLPPNPRPDAPKPGHLNVHMGGLTNTHWAAPLLPALTPAQYEQQMRPGLARIAGSIFDMARQLQEENLNDNSSDRGAKFEVAPPGFTVSVSGSSTGSEYVFARTPILLPTRVDLVATKLERYLTYLVKDVQDPTSMAEASGKVAQKISIPPFMEVRLTGPKVQMYFRVPTAPSSEYPTAADVRRASEALIREKVKEAVAPLRKLNDEATGQH